MWPTIRAGRAQQVGSLLVWAEGFSSSCQLPSPWQMSVWAEPQSRVSRCVQLDAAPGKPSSSSYPVLCRGRAGLLLPLLLLEGPVPPWQMGGSSARVSRRFNPAGPCVGQGLPSPGCTWQCACWNCFARELHWICMKGNGASWFTFHLCVLLQLLPHPCWTAAPRQGLAMGLAGAFLLQHDELARTFPSLAPLAP